MSGIFKRFFRRKKIEPTSEAKDSPSTTNRFTRMFKNFFGKKKSNPINKKEASTRPTTSFIKTFANFFNRKKPKAKKTQPPKNPLEGLTEGTTAYAEAMASEEYGDYLNWESKKSGIHILF